MVAQGTRVILRQHSHLPNAAVGHIAQCKINGAIAAADGQCRRRSMVGQNAQSAVVIAACQNNTDCFHLLHLPYNGLAAFQSAVGIILREGSAVNHAVFPHHNPIGNTAVHAQNGDACIINIRLWDEAKWSGCVFGMFSYIPFIGFMFENFDAGKEIFSQWIDLLGREDKNNTIKLTVIKGISNNNPFAYKVAVSYNEQNIRTEGVLGLITRFQRMDPSSSQNLEDFLANQKRSGQFILLPSYMQSGKPEIDLSQAILLHKIYIIDAWQIDENSTLRCVIQVDDDIVIPKDHNEDAPVLKILKKL